MIWTPKEVRWWRCWSTMPVTAGLTLYPDGSFNYTPDAGFVGTDQFQYLAYDFLSESAPAVVWLEVAGPAGTVGDLNGDHLVDAADLQLLSAALQAGLQNDLYDLTRDGLVDHQDLLYLVEDLLETSIGDANLDGQFNSSDMVAVFQAGRYESGQPGSADWSTGDWNCDGVFNTSDLVFAFAQGDYETAAAASILVPELPSTDTRVPLASVRDESVSIGESTQRRWAGETGMGRSSTKVKMHRFARDGGRYSPLKLLPDPFRWRFELSARHTHNRTGEVIRRSPRLWLRVNDVAATPCDVKLPEPREPYRRSCRRPGCRLAACPLRRPASSTLASSFRSCSRSQTKITGSATGIASSFSNLSS